MFGKNHIKGPFSKNVIRLLEQQVSIFAADTLCLDGVDSDIVDRKKLIKLSMNAIQEVADIVWAEAERQFEIETRQNSNPHGFHQWSSTKIQLPREEVKTMLREIMQEDKKAPNKTMVEKPCREFKKEKKPQPKETKNNNEK